MRCSKCGSPNHNIRTCPYRDEEMPRDQAVWFKIDHINSREVVDLLASIMRVKDRVAPEGRATGAKGKVSELPDRVREAQGLLGGE